MTAVLDQQKEFVFVIEDDIPFKTKKITILKNDPLNEAIYNHANKLNEGQSFFLPISLFGEIKYRTSKISNVLFKLTEFWKNNKKEVLYKIKTIKNEDNIELGYRIWRLEIPAKKV